MYLREITLVSRNAASWTWREIGSQFDHTTFDKSGERRIFGSKTEALQWMTGVQEGCVQAARAVLRSRELVLAEWLSRLQEYK